MSTMSDSRKNVLMVLRQYLNGGLKEGDLIEWLSEDFGDDNLLDDIVNTFCEPLTDCPEMATWEEVTQLCTRAIEEDWTSEFLCDVLENGLPGT